MNENRLEEIETKPALHDKAVKELKEEIT